MQASILEALRIGYPDVFPFSVPNGGFILEPRTVAKLLWQGLAPGVPDLVLVWTGGMGFIEVKREGGRLSPEQTHVHAILRAKGHRVAVCRSVDDLTQTMAEWAVPTRVRA